VVFLLFPLLMQWRAKGLLPLVAEDSDE